MEEILNINGVEYIRKDSISTSEEKFKELKKIVEQSLTSMEEVNKVLSEYVDNVDIEEEVKRTEVRHSTDKSEIYQTSRRLYSNIIMEEDGTLVINHRSRTMNVKDIIAISEDMKTITSMIDLTKKWKKKFNPNHFHRIVYNIQNEIFDLFIKQFKKQLASKKDDIFRVKPYHQKAFTITNFNEDGTFILGNGVKSQFNIIDVVKIKNRVIGKDITSERAKIIAKEFDFTYGIFERIIYTLQKGIFDFYIDKWRTDVNNVDFPKKEKPQFQNNREKRIEQGFGGVIPSS